ncbi:hypothetical protein EX895_000850 [Sporisorium graminicola]|uniref:Uncharacterized protein n=1 Tax=Sporisorium graminicola TaxID=280036 RepID=A0A4U7L5Q4_9BASI|nr:hypothetical protein EX895_000850 [Sporisorium graminicola]TKY90852.1 hypothetical protein EX895_000850 [Sporisorium graminicola]
MVLQNKYKAKASRRYNSEKATTEHTEPSSSKPGYRTRFANKYGRNNNGLNRSHDGQQQADSDSDSQDGSIGSSDEDEDGDAEFPSLAKAAAASDPSQAPRPEQDASNPSRGKYARRKLGESKLARLERLEAAKDPRLPDDEEPEPEVDISNLVARVAALGDSASTQAGIAEEIARSRGQHETASDVENDIDHSLAYLHEKERQRQKAKGRGGAVHSPPDEARKAALEALNVDADGNAIDYEALQKEKEKAEAVRALKARFQGHGVGERQRQDAKTRTVPSIQIGPHAASPSSSKSSSGESMPSTDGAPATGTLSDSLAAEIESSLAKARSSSANAETSSVASGRSSFSTTFGRRKSPLAATTTSTSQADRPHSGGSSSAAVRTERIDSFLFSLNDRSLAGGKDPSVFSLSSAGLNGGSIGKGSSPQLYRGSNRFDPPRMPQQKSAMPSTPGEMGRLESFLDDMLG